MFVSTRNPSIFEISVAVKECDQYFIKMAPTSSSLVSVISGARFAIYQTKIGLIKILRNYQVQVCEKTPIPYVFDPIAFIMCPKEGLYLKIIKNEI